MQTICITLQMELQNHLPGQFGENVNIEYFCLFAKAQYGYNLKPVSCSVQL